MAIRTTLKEPLRLGPYDPIENLASFVRVVVGRSDTSLARFLLCPKSQAFQGSDNRRLFATCMTLNQDASIL